ncbi:hypothetical protein [Blastococcus saxobsidens]|uniref:Uncharacterized protein n=1 Tax=Blastococcus saxobsidens TaxID=138336 RepID=A0A4Q7Y4F5_9ACTN|nr:hypothetical protein [Blastococcus saxobsidens]RZU31817.1 hypothetical protein BKA19_1499 [Blastococcus saxobsidens]
MDHDVPRTGSGSRTRGLPVPAPEDAEAESAAAPSIPSFASLRDTRRRSPVDLLLGPQEPVVDAAPPAPPTGGPRPAEWADLWHIGLRLARWCVRQPLSTARRLLG